MLIERIKNPGQLFFSHGESTMGDTFVIRLSWKEGNRDAERLCKEGKNHE